LDCITFSFATPMFEQTLPICSIISVEFPERKSFYLVGRYWLSQ